MADRALTAISAPIGAFDTPPQAERQHSLRIYTYIYDRLIYANMLNWCQDDQTRARDTSWLDGGFAPNYLYVMTHMGLLGAINYGSFLATRDNMIWELLYRQTSSAAPPHYTWQYTNPPSRARANYFAASSSITRQTHCAYIYASSMLTYGKYTQLISRVWPQPFRAVSLRIIRWAAWRGNYFPKTMIGGRVKKLS